MKRTHSAILLLTTLAAPASLYAQDMKWLDSFSSGLRTLLNGVGVMLIALAVAVFVWGIVTFIATAGDQSITDEKTKATTSSRQAGKRRIVWGIVSIFVILSVWGFVALLQDITSTDPDKITAPRSK